MVLAELTRYLSDNSYGVEGTDLVYGYLPASPYAVTSLAEYGGVANEVTLNSSTVSMEHPFVQAHVRGAQNDYDGPRLKIQQLVALFTAIKEQTLSGVQYHAVMAIQSPFWVGQDANFCHSFKVNFRTWKGFSAT